MTPTSLKRLQHFYKGKNIFITGHTGFKGSWLSAWLSRWGANVTGYALPPQTNPSLFKEARLNKQVNSTLADIRDEKSLQKAMQSAKPDLIFHLAAQALVLRSYQNPAETFSTNVLGTANLLDCAAHLKNPCPVVLVTSDKCYTPSASSRALTERAALGGAKDPYSISKAMAEQVASYWREQLGYCALATARAGNVIGGGDWAADRLLPEIILCTQAHKPIPLRMPDAVRPWQYVLDCLFGYLMLGERLAANPQKFAQAWNFGPHNRPNVTVQELAQQAVHILGAGRIIPRPSKQKNETSYLRLSAAKARRKLGWKNHYTTLQAMQHTLHWYQAFYAGENARQLLESELAAYEKLLH